jgi:hypothetical protein
VVLKRIRACLVFPTHVVRFGRSSRCTLRNAAATPAKYKFGAYVGGRIVHSSSVRHKRNTDLVCSAMMRCSMFSHERAYALVPQPALHFSGVLHRVSRVKMWPRVCECSSWRLETCPPPHVVLHNVTRSLQCVEVPRILRVD